MRRAAAPGQFISYAGSDIARGETLLRRGTRIGSREIGMLAACGLAEVDVVRRPKVAVLSTGDELVPPGEPLRPAGVYDSNGAIIAAAVAEAGGEPVAFGAFPDDEARAGSARCARALARCDMVVLSGGTSKGAGDLSHRVVSQLGAPGILVHGVALKPGKPLCLGGGRRQAGRGAAGLSDLGDLHVPRVRRAGDPRAGRPAAGSGAKPSRRDVPVRIASELGRKEFVLVALVAGRGRAGRVPDRQRAPARSPASRRPTASSRSTRWPPRSMPAPARSVTLIGSAARAPDLVIMGSHDVALDVVVGALAERGFTARTLAVGSLGGVAAAQRGECDIAPVHLIDPASGRYNEHLSRPDSRWCPAGGACRASCSAPAMRASRARARPRRIKAALADPACLMVNRNAGAGTRVLIDQLLDGARPAGYANQPKIAQCGRRRGRAGPRRLGRRHRAGGEAVWSRLPAGRAGRLRFSPGRKPARRGRRCRRFSPRCATRGCASASARSACARAMPNSGR